MRAAWIPLLAMLATAAFTRSAAAQVSVIDEATDQSCGEVTLEADHSVVGGCRVHIVSGQETPGRDNHDQRACRDQHM